MLIASRYEATGAAAWGGMSEVYHFIDTHLDRKVVLKRVKKTADTPRLLDEQKALLALRTKHVVELLDIVEYDFLGVDETGLVLEFISGTDLTEGSFSFDQSYLRTLWQVASGLTDVHNAGVIHRDIKPGNIRRDEMGVLKIFDFGLARESGVDDKTRSIAGTDGYMAPELHGTSTIGFSSAIDVYAFGATALSLLIPQASQGNADIQTRCQTILAAADPELIQVIEKCHADDPAARPMMSEVRDLLARILLHKQHRANFFNGPILSKLDAAKSRITLNTGVGSVIIQYDGHDFIVDSVSGNVTINNKQISNGDKVSSSGVIIFRHADGRFAACLPYESSRCCQSNANRSLPDGAIAK